MFPCSMIHVPKKCCDQSACEPPSEEMAKPTLAIVSEINLQGTVMFLMHQFWSEVGSALKDMECLFVPQYHLQLLLSSYSICDSEISPQIWS